jgi:hypothetical protein
VCLCIDLYKRTLPMLHTRFGPRFCHHYFFGHIIRPTKTIPLFSAYQLVGTLLSDTTISDPFLALRSLLLHPFFRHLRRRSASLSRSFKCHYCVRNFSLRRLLHDSPIRRLSLPLCAANMPHTSSNTSHHLSAAITPVSIKTSSADYTSTTASLKHRHPTEPVSLEQTSVKSTKSFHQTKQANEARLVRWQFGK